MEMIKRFGPKAARLTVKVVAVFWASNLMGKAVDKAFDRIAV